jgi:hypothetical protein
VNTSLSVVVPAYNERRRLAVGLQRLMEEVPSEDTEIIVVDDCSTDDTAAIARAELAGWPAAAVVSLPQNRGKGAAVKAGVVRARGEAVMFADADMAADVGDLKDLVGALNRSHVAVGSRSHPASEVAKRGVQRTFANRAFGLVVASMTALSYTDTQCGFKAFRGPVAKLLFHGAQLERFAFDVEVLDLAVRMGLRIEEVPVRWLDMPGSTVHPVRDGLQMVGDVARIPSRRRRIPPVSGLWLPDLAAVEAASVVSPFVRATDLVVGWKQGTAVLFPCSPPSVASHVATRTAAMFEPHRSEPITIPFDALWHPVLVSDLHTDEYAM